MVLYEMLSGENPFGAGEDVPLEGIAYRIMHDEVPALPVTVAYLLPRKVGLALGAALSKDPAGRFATAGDFALALREAGRKAKAVALAAPVA